MFGKIIDLSYFNTIEMNKIHGNMKINWFSLTFGTEIMENINSQD